MAVAILPMYEVAASPHGERSDFMLPPFIIEQIRKREEDQTSAERPQPALELPMPPRQREPRKGEEQAERGVLIIDLLG